MRERFARFMTGRYGVDSLGKALTWISMALLLLSVFLPFNIVRSICWAAAIVMLVLNYFRMFSRNYSARAEENRRYERFADRFRRTFGNWKYKRAQNKAYHIYRCPSCHQKIRVPRGKGRIEISCPKCGSKFIKKS